MEQSNYPLLDTIDSPADLKQLPLTDLPKLCEDVRCFLLETLSKVRCVIPGANFGVVELTVALHYVFDIPHDEIVWICRAPVIRTQDTNGSKKGFLYASPMGRYKWLYPP